MSTTPALTASDASVSGYQFRPTDLAVDRRLPGISAFMRIRNGAEFLAATIRSHIEFFDEIVAVYNQCTDQTPAILETLQREFGPDRLRVIHYADRVYPPGSAGHAKTRANSPHSLVNYYNFALAATRFQYATKLDDDHVAIEAATRVVTDALRSGRTAPDRMLCFSGLNLFRQPDGHYGVLAADPISGNGDIGFFRVGTDTFFTHDRRFERFQRGKLRREFAGFLYWHLKYLKSDLGFGCYELAQNQTSRYAKRKAALERTTPATFSLEELAVSRQSSWLNQVAGWLSDKHAFRRQRDAAIRQSFPDASVNAAVHRTLRPELFSMLRPQPAETADRKVA